MSYDKLFPGCVHDNKNIKGFVSTYRWLSNFYPAKVSYKGLDFDYVENGYQAAKCKGYAQIFEFCTIHPSFAKSIGKTVTLREDWDDVKLDVMEGLLRQKFSDKNPKLKQQLIDTNDKYLEETNWWNDKFWGVCKGKGENNLGKLLMKIRTELQLNVL